MTQQQVKCIYSSRAPIFHDSGGGGGGVEGWGGLGGLESPPVLKFKRVFSPFLDFLLKGICFVAFVFLFLVCVCVCVRAHVCACVRACVCVCMCCF